MFGQGDGCSASLCEFRGLRHGSEDMEGICSPQGDSYSTTLTGFECPPNEDDSVSEDIVIGIVTPATSNSLCLYLLPVWRVRAPLQL